MSYDSFLYSSVPVNLKSIKKGKDLHGQEKILLEFFAPGRPSSLFPHPLTVKNFLRAADKMAKYAAKMRSKAIASTVDK